MSTRSSPRLSYAAVLMKAVTEAPSTIPIPLRATATAPVIGTPPFDIGSKPDFHLTPYISPALSRLSSDAGSGATTPSLLTPTRETPLPLPLPPVSRDVAGQLLDGGTRAPVVPSVEKPAVLTEEGLTPFDKKFKRLIHRPMFITFYGTPLLSKTEVGIFLFGNPASQPPPNQPAEEANGEVVYGEGMVIVDDPKYMVGREEETFGDC